MHSDRKADIDVMGRIF